MTTNRLRIGVVATGSCVDQTIAERVLSLAAALYPERTPHIEFHPNCFAISGHFAGDDASRADAFVQVANDARYDALWFARGGYGSCRIVETVLPRLTDAARKKMYLGYSDVGTLLSTLYRAGFPHVVHGPMPADIKREGGQEAVARALAFLVDGDPASIEPSVVSDPVVAFNITILAHLVGTPWLPDLTGHIILLEEVSEPLYRIDRALCQIASDPGFRRAAGVRLGRCAPIIPNEPDFGQTEEEIARHWCKAAGIAYLGRADIGHDVANKVVPFGRARTS